MHNKYITDVDRRRKKGIHKIYPLQLKEDYRKHKINNVSYSKIVYKCHPVTFRVVRVGVLENLHFLFQLLGKALPVSLSSSNFPNP